MGIGDGERERRERMTKSGDGGGGVSGVDFMIVVRKLTMSCTVCRSSCQP